MATSPRRKSAPPRRVPLCQWWRRCLPCAFPDTDYKFYLDASLDERSKRRAADGVDENLAERDKQDSQRAAAPLMIPLGAKVINNSEMTAEETSALIISEVQEKLEAAG